MPEFAPARHPGLPQLTAYALGRLPGVESAAIQSHLRECPACRKILATLPGNPDSQSEQDTALPPHAAAGPRGGRVPAGLAGHARYEVLELLGRGGMGAVYKARHKVMNRLVALKVVNPDLLLTATGIERFHREVQAAARLAHPNIVIAHDADQAGDTHFLVMEFVAGTDLARYVEKKGPLPVTYACHCIRQAALGLQHAHELGMVHRDIKPHNLLLTPQGVVKVTDFGLARLAREAASTGGLTGENVLMGTADYIAPEQAQDARRADIRADIYSLGCTLFHLLAGRPPFAGGTAVQKVAGHLMMPVPLAELPAAVPEALRGILARMMDKAPAKRYPTPAAVAKALAPFVNKASGVNLSAVSSAASATEPPQAPPPLLPVAGAAPGVLQPPPAARPGRRDGKRNQHAARKWALIGSLLAGLLGGLLVAFLLWHPSRAQPTKVVDAATAEQSSRPTGATTAALPATKPFPPTTAPPPPVMPPKPPPTVKPPITKQLVPLTPETDIAELRRALRDEDPARQEQAAGLLANLGEKAREGVKELAWVLKDSTVVKVRCNAAVALARIGVDARPAVPVLAEALRPQAPVQVRRSAAETLAQLRFPTIEDALPAVVAAIAKDPDELVRQRCVWASFAVPDLESHDLRKVLIAVLDEKTPDSTLVRYDAARLLAYKLREDAPDRVGDVLLEMLENRTLKVFLRSEVRVSDPGAKADAGQTQVEEKLGGDARYMAAEALASLGKKASSRKDIIEALKLATKDSDAKLREAATDALKGLGNP
jgi:serine/threonine protein kinase/HEAT repeat protein